MASRNMLGQALDTLGEAIASLVAKGMLVTGPRLIARDPAGAERASLVRIDGAAEDIEQVLGSRRRLPSVAEPARQLKGRRPAVVRSPPGAPRRCEPAKT